MRKYVLAGVVGLIIFILLCLGINLLKNGEDAIDNGVLTKREEVSEYVEGILINRIKDYEAFILMGRNFNSFLEFSDEEIIALVLNYSSSLGNRFTKNELDTAISDIYGKYKLVRLGDELYDLGCDIPIYVYDSESEKYVYNEEHYGHGIIFDHEYHFSKFFNINSYKEDNKYIISTSIVYKNDYMEGYFSLNSNEPFIISGTDFSEGDYQKYRDLLSQVKFVFDENYILVDVL